jgi:hypothetical protein
MAREGESEAAILQERLQELQAKERDELNRELVELAREVREVALRIEGEVDEIRLRLGFILFLMLLPLIIGVAVGLFIGLQNG